MNSTFKQKYQRSKDKFLSDKTICKENIDLYKAFLEHQEYKLKRIRNLPSLDEGNYKTLYLSIQRLKNINVWFHNKPLKDITKEDIKRVYDGLEDGIILNGYGKPYKDRSNYYSKFFKSKLFEMIKKDDLAREVIEFHKPQTTEVRFITEEDFGQIINNAYKPLHRLLFWLAWDIGENINSLLKLRKKDFYKQKNPHTKEPEYAINLRKDILKRSRKPRTEITNYRETYNLIEQTLTKIPKDDELIFNFDYRNAKKILDRAVERANVKCKPNGEKATWKDLRSSMACHLLKSGYTTDEVNARLGHAPSSSEIDKYVNFLAIDRHTPKKKVHQFEMEKLNDELQEMKRREKLQAERNELLQAQFEAFRKDILKKLVAEIKVKKNI